MFFGAQYADETGAQVQCTGAPVPFATVGARLPFQLVFYAQAGTPIRFVVATASSATYGFHLRLEAL